MNVFCTDFVDADQSVWRVGLDKFKVEMKENITMSVTICLKLPEPTKVLMVQSEKCRFFTADGKFYICDFKASQLQPMEFGVLCLVSKNLFSLYHPYDGLLPVKTVGHPFKGEIKHFSNDFLISSDDQRIYVYQTVKGVNTLTLHFISWIEIE